ncbi:hypothetical protein BASA81_006581 [Batrachochytrium salamandrivorans]|nr:hypothetical protein BASA81_006581 [Batrachochytrium salamandrivorans]
MLLLLGLVVLAGSAHAQIPTKAPMTYNYDDDNADPYATVLSSPAYVAAIVIPILFFFIALALSVFVCQKHVNTVVGGYGVSNDKFIQLRKRSAQAWILALLVWFSNWVSIWSVFAYFVTVGIFLIAVYAFYKLGLSDFASNALVQNSANIKIGSLVSAGILALHAILAIALVGTLASQQAQYCSFVPGSSCQAIYGPHVFFGVVAALAMVALAFVFYKFACELDELANLVRTANNGGTVGAAGGGGDTHVAVVVPEDKA